MDADASYELRALWDLGFFGHYLHVHAGGRSGKQHVLASLLDHDGHLSQREMLSEAGISSASLSEVLAKLEAEGLISRSRSAEDGRQREVELTDAGLAKARDLVEQREEFESRCLSIFNEEEKRQLVSQLDRLVGHWKSIEESKEQERKEDADGASIH